MAKKRRLKVVPPKVSTYPWVVVRVIDAGLGVRFTCVDASRTRKGADALAVKKVSENGGVYAVLQYRNVFAPQVVGKAPVAAKGLVAPETGIRSLGPEKFPKWGSGGGVYGAVQAGTTPPEAEDDDDYNEQED